MRAAVCVIGVALLAAFLPHQALSQDRNTKQAENIFQPHFGQGLYSMVQGERFWGSWPARDNTWRSNLSNEASHDYTGRRFPPKPNAPACLSAHIDREFNWSMVMRDPQPGRGGWKNWEPSYYRFWRRTDANCY